MERPLGITCFLLKLPVQSRISYSRLLRATSSEVLNTSKGGNSVICLGDLFQSLTILTIRKSFHLFKGIFLYLLLCPLPLFLSLDTTKKSLTPSFLLPPIYRHESDVSQASSSPDSTVPVLTASPHTRGGPML